MLLVLAQENVVRLEPNRGAFVCKPSADEARQAVEEIDAAIERIRKGVYGVCVLSGKNIPKERLKAIPWAAERVEYKAGGLGRR